ncbi:MAG: hypothetical protein KA198_07460 [Chitinophagaceae bacterium]|nr:hypothetical protein [Chitinophagaceae bacterium]
MRFNFILFLLFQFTCLNQSSAQTSILNQFKNEFEVSQSKKDKGQVALKICEQFNSLSADSLSKYVQIGLENSARNSPDFFRLKNFYTYTFLKNSKSKEANIYIDSLIHVASHTQIKESIRLEILYNKIICLIRDNQYKLAMDSAINLLKASEKLADTLSIMKSYSALGLANMELENEGEAVNWLRKGINFTRNENLLAMVNSLFLNIASCYKVREGYDSAMLFINQGLTYTIQLENLTNQANALNIRAGIYSKMNKKNDAQKDLENALILRQKVGDLHYTIADMGVLSFFYTYNNQALKGIEIAKQGIMLAEKTGNIYKLIYLKKGLANAYHGAKQYEKAYLTSTEIVGLKDSLYEANTEKAIADLEAKYELQKKENIIIQQENKLIRSRYTTYVSLILLGLGALLTWLIYRNYRHVQSRKMEKALAEEKINSLKAVQLAEEKERKRIAADLHDNLGSYAAAITSNIKYLKDKSSEDNNQLISQLDENAQGIVTQLSDSIWVLKNEHLPITKLADRFKSWAQKLMLNYPNVNYNYEENITNDIELAPAKILNLFLILKECLTNSLKHSDCNTINIQFINTDFIHITIEDNGKGFQSNLINRGTGLDNIKHRAKECELQVKWEVLEPTGTRVTIHQPTIN